jgi:hypothetical protein
MRQCFANHLEVNELWSVNSLMREDLAAKTTHLADVPNRRLGGRLRVWSRWDDVTILTSPPRFSLRSI